jgi:hypothetical protein
MPRLPAGLRFTISRNDEVGTVASPDQPPDGDTGPDWVRGVNEAGEGGVHSRIRQSEHVM